MTSKQILADIPLYDGHDAYLGMVFQYADGCRHSLQRFGDNRRFTLGEAVTDFRATYDRLVEHPSHRLPARSAHFIRIGDRNYLFNRLQG